jgi:hypothetical protein
MPDLNPDDAPTPIVVPASPAADQAGSLLRDALIVVSAMPAAMAALGSHDTSKMVAYVTSSAAFPALSVLATAAVVGWRQWITRRKHADAVKMADNLPNDKARVAR